MISFEKVSKTYGKKKVVEDLSFTIESGERFVLIGPSGCGKTTTLRMLNRLEETSGGRIVKDGVDLKEVDVTELRRSIGYVIQQTGLFNHKTVEENIGIILELEGVEEEVRKRRVREVMKLVNLPYEDYHDAYPSELSGGQRQRVGVARALVIDPDVILMDEPFSALDPMTRADLQEEVLRLHEETKKTIVFVTHDMEEAMKLGQRILLMKDGHIGQLGTPEEFLRDPASDFVESFVGEGRIWDNPEFIKVKDFMDESPVILDEALTVKEALKHLSRQEREYFICTREGAYRGVLGTFELMASHTEARLREIFGSEAAILKEETTLPEVMELFKNPQVMAGVVFRDEAIVGLVTRAHLVRLLATRYEEVEG